MYETFHQSAPAPNSISQNNQHKAYHCVVSKMSKHILAPLDS
jgi:hypothetical protein